MIGLYAACCWWLLPGDRRHTWIACCLGCLSVGLGVLAYAVIRLVGALGAIRSQRARRAQLEIDAIDWIESVQIQVSSGVSVANAFRSAYHQVSSLGLPTPDGDLDQQCQHLSQSGIGLWVAVGQGLPRLIRQGGAIDRWLAELIDRHYATQDEMRQSAAAAMGSKLLMPLILGALPQAFLIIGFVVMNS